MDVQSQHTGRWAKEVVKLQTGDTCATSQYNWEDKEECGSFLVRTKLILIPVSNKFQNDSTVFKCTVSPCLWVRIVRHPGSNVTVSHTLNKTLDRNFSQFHRMPPSSYLNTAVSRGSGEGWCYQLSEVSNRITGSRYEGVVTRLGTCWVGRRS